MKLAWLDRIFDKDERSEFSDPFFQSAVGVFVLSAIFAVCAGIAVIRAEDPAAVARTFQPFFFVLFGAVTFLTIAWRGRISERQSWQQADQLRLAQIQARADEELNLADGLRKGTELIANEDGTMQLAGIVSLDAVARNPNPVFSAAAMELLANYLQSNFSDGHDDYRCRAAIKAINAAALQPVKDKRYSRKSDHELDFTADDQANCIWQPVIGVSNANYKNGCFTSVLAFNRAVEEMPLVTFEGVTFERCLINFFGSFINCKFVQCQFTRYKPKDLTFSEFQHCNFSNCLFPGTLKANDFPSGFQNEGNYVVRGRPPRSDAEFDWSPFLREVGPEDAINIVPAQFEFDPIDIDEDQEGDR